MDDVSELELRITDKFATKEDLARVEGKVESVGGTVVSQGKTLALVEYKLNGILGALNKLVWLVAAPVVTGFLAGIIWVFSQMVG